MPGRLFVPECELFTPMLHDPCHLGLGVTASYIKSQLAVAETHRFLSFFFFLRNKRVQSGQPRTCEIVPQSPLHPPDFRLSSLGSFQICGPEGLLEPRSSHPCSKQEEGGKGGKGGLPVVCIRSSFLPAVRCSLMRIHHNLLIHPPVEGHLVCLWF